VQATGTVSGVSVYKSPLIPAIETSALSVDAATLNLPAVAGTSLAQGRFLNAATAREPVAVLGAAAAQRLGIDRIRPGMRIWAGGQWFYVTGILKQATLAPEIDSAVLVGFPAAEKYLHFDGHPSQIYVRTVDTLAATTAVDNLLGAQASPENPSQVTVSQPSAALTAQAPASRCIWNSCGAIAVLPCGASRTPCRRQKPAIASRLCRRAAPFRTMTGNMKSPSSTFQPWPATARIGIAGPAGKDL